MEDLLRRYGRKARLFAIALVAVAGYIDAIGFLASGGFFVSFMSGNSTRVAVAFADHSSPAWLGLALIFVFVCGVVAGSLLGRAAQVRRATAILGFIAVVLAVAATLMTVGAPGPALLALSFAMGAENTVFAEAGEVRIGLTYMTGTLVRIGKGVAAALCGGDPMGWAPYLLLWSALVVGAGIGAVTWLKIGPAALWGAAGVMAVLAIISTCMSLSLLQEPGTE